MGALIETLGGVGLFLFGMALMTSGLRKLAGDRLRQWLARSTRNQISGVATGATVTALIQSSSATTVAAIGFVGAGLMTFTQSLGIIFGANIGTTITGWMVALLGFELKLAEAALPLLFVAALCYLFKPKRRLRAFGKALAGFCLIFLGISFLQEGLAEYRDVIDLSEWQASSIQGRVMLVLIGIVLTLITQSSSATVAAALTALNASLLDLPQAVAVIIGADIGTTGTAALATIGGTTGSRRTGFAHVIYNVMTGVGAFFFLPVYLLAVDRFLPEVVGDSPEMVAVAFHSLFNLLGVVIALPLARPFSRFIERLFPEKTARLSAPFDDSLLEEPSAALAALEFGCRQLAAAGLDAAVVTLSPRSGNEAALAGLAGQLNEIFSAVEKGRDYAVHVGQREDDDPPVDTERVFACLHLIDHIERLAERSLSERQAAMVRETEPLESEAAAIVKLMSHLSKVLVEEGEERQERGSLDREMAVAATEFEEDKHRFRQQVIGSATTGELAGDKLDAQLDAHRWLRRMTYHAWRIACYTAEIEG